MKKLHTVNNYFYFNPYLQTKTTELTNNSSIEQTGAYSAEYQADLVNRGKSYNIKLATQELNHGRLRLLECLVDEMDNLAKRAIELDIDWDYSSYNPSALETAIVSLTDYPIGKNLKTDEELKASLIEEYRSFNLPELNFEDISLVNLYKIVKPYKIAFDELDAITCEQHDFWVLSKAKQFNIPILKKIFLNDKSWNESILFQKLCDQVEKMDELAIRAYELGINWNFNNYDPVGLAEAIKEVENQEEEDECYRNSIKFDFCTSRGC